MGAPLNPATTPSLPGANSTRTDGGIASKQATRYISGMPSYGDGQELAQTQAMAPMGATPDIGSGAAPANATPQQAAVSQMQQTPVVPFTAPTMNPNEPVTAGSPSGPGVGPSALGLMPMQMGGATARQTVQALAAHPDASPELKNLANTVGQ